MKRALGAAFLGLVAVCGTGRAEWSVNAQLERFRWIEKTTPTEVRETGARMGLGWSWLQNKERGLIARYRGGVYAASVRHEGQEGAATSTDPATTGYAGIVNELHALYRPSAGYGFQLIGGLGMDYWQRKVPSASVTEDWGVLFARFGIEADTWLKRGLSVAAGFKYPLATSVNAHFTERGFGNNERLTPGSELSGYGEVGYRFSGHWRLAGYYDRYRFAQSSSVRLTAGRTTAIASQARSSLEAVGLRLEYFF